VHLACVLYLLLISGADEVPEGDKLGVYVHVEQLEDACIGG